MRPLTQTLAIALSLASIVLSSVAVAQLNTSAPKQNQVTPTPPAPQPDKVMNCGSEHAIEYGLAAGTRGTALSGACTSVVSSTPSPCVNAPANWGPGNACAAIGNANHGANVTLTSTSPQFAGTAAMQCINGVFYPNGSPAPTCTQIFQDCPARSYTWSVGTTTCSSSQLPGFAHGTDRTAANVVSGVSGSAVYRCNNGTAELRSSSCVRADNPCPAQTFTWTVGAFTCSASVGSVTPHNGTVTSTVPAGQPTQGSITHRCINGGFQQVAPGPSCSASPQTTGACRSFSGTHASQPATNSGTGCTAGTFLEQSDTTSQWRWGCQGSSGTPLAACTAQRSATPTPTPTPAPGNAGVCRSYSGTHSSQPATNSSTGCSFGTFQDQSDTSAQWRWNCQGAAGTPATACSAQRGTAPTPTPAPGNAGVCRSYSGSYSTQPATSNSTACTSGTFQEQSDTTAQWRWNCQGTSGTPATACTAQRSAAPTPPPQNGAPCQIVEQHQSDFTGGSPTIIVYDCPDRADRNHVIPFAPSATRNYGFGFLGGEAFRRRTLQHNETTQAKPTSAAYRAKGSGTMRCVNGTVVLERVFTCGID